MKGYYITDGGKHGPFPAEEFNRINIYCSFWHRKNDGDTLMGRPVKFMRRCFFQYGLRQHFRNIDASSYVCNFTLTNDARDGPDRLNCPINIWTDSAVCDDWDCVYFMLEQKIEKIIDYHEQEFNMNYAGNIKQMGHLTWMHTMEQQFEHWKRNGKNAIRTGGFTK